MTDLSHPNTLIIWEENFYGSLKYDWFYNLSQDYGKSIPGTVHSATYRQISVEEAVQLMEEKTDYIILDVRRPEEFAVGHIPGAVNVPNETIDTGDIPELDR